MKTKSPTLTEISNLLRDLKPSICNDCRASDDPDDNTPGICVTVGASPDGTWDYQTGDNSYTGAAYFHKYWGVVYLYRNSNCKELARECLGEIRDAYYEIEIK